MNNRRKKYTEAMEIYLKSKVRILNYNMYKVVPRFLKYTKLYQIFWKKFWVNVLISYS